MQKFTTILLLLGLLSSCGSFQKSGNSGGAALVHAQYNQSGDQKLVDENHLKNSLEKAEIRLEELVAEAKVAGAEAVTFLSGDLFLKANDASIRGDNTTAALLFKYVHLLKPNDNWVKRKYAVELIRVGDLEKSEKMLAEIYQSEGVKDENIGLILGGVYTALDNSKDARKIYKKVMKAHPKNEEACIFLSKSYALEKEHKKAQALLKSCEKKIKDKAIFSYFLGKMSVDLGNRKKAMNHFRHALKIDKKYYQAAIALGLLFEEKENFDQSVKVYEKYLKTDKLNYPVLSRLVQVLFANGNYKKVLSFAERLSSLDQSDLNLKVRLGILYTDRKMYLKAISVFKEILIAAPNSDKILYYLGSLFQQTSKFEDAIGYFQKVPSESTLFLDSNLQIAQMLQALAMRDRNLWEPKLIEFGTATKTGDHKVRIEVGVLLASYWEGLSKIGKAVTTLEDLKSLADFNEGHEYYLASLYEKNKAFDKARAVIEAMLVKNPDNPHALNFLGYSLLEKGMDMERAYKLIKKAVDLKPEDGFIRDSLAWYYFKSGKLADALRESKRANEAVGNDVVITKHLAIIYKKMKNYTLAKKYYLKALKQCKVESERREVLAELQDLEVVRLPASKKPTTN
jgi:tetratricopeptide (TPR) repeat protein